MASIVLAGFAANDPLPGSYVQTDFAQGDATGTEGDKLNILVGNKSAAGSATPDTVIYGVDTPVQCQTEGDVIALFGEGSPLHRAFRRWTKINNTSKLYFLAVTESAGTAATGTVTFTNAATALGTVRFMLDEEFVEVTFLPGDAISVTAAALAAAINAKSAWPVTASATAGVVTITAKVKGPRGNYIRYQVRITSQTAPGTTVTPVADTALTGGATADSWTAALATLASKRYWRIIPEADDTATLGALTSQVNGQSAAMVGLRQVVIAATTDTLANALTNATGRNTARAEIGHLRGSQWTPFEHAANLAAIFAKYEDAGGFLGETNFAGFGQDEASSRDWYVPAPRDASLHPTPGNLRAALNGGLSPIGVNANGTTYLVNRITTRSLQGSTPDYRIRDSHKREITDRFGDAWQAKQILQFSRRKLADDFKPGVPPPGASVITPKIIKAAQFALIDAFAREDLLGSPDQVDRIKAKCRVERDTVNRSRIYTYTPLLTADNAYQFGNVVAQVG